MQEESQGLTQRCRGAKDCRSHLSATSAFPRERHAPANRSRRPTYLRTPPCALFAIRHRQDEQAKRSTRRRGKRGAGLSSLRALRLCVRPCSLHSPTLSSTRGPSGFNKAIRLTTSQRVAEGIAGSHAKAQRRKGLQKSSLRDFLASAFPREPLSPANRSRRPTYLRTPPVLSSASVTGRMDRQKGSRGGAGNAVLKCPLCELCAFA